jgi:hypothetical protein
MDYEKEGIVSLWVANLKSEALLETLMEAKFTEAGDFIPSDFAKLCETGHYDEDFREAGFREGSISDIAEALEESSDSEEFIEAFEDMAADIISESYNATILLYNFQYEGNEEKIVSDTYGTIKFVGYARYDYSNDELIAEVSAVLGKLPWEYEKKLYNLDSDKSRDLFECIEEIESLQDLDSYL